MPAARICEVLISIGLLFANVGCGDHQEHFYQTIADADKDAATNRGWVPDEWLPKSTHAIHEAHELSPENEWCAFEFDPADSQKLRKVLTHADSLPAGLKHVPNPHASWWPEPLRGDLDLSKIHSAGLDVYTAERPATGVTTATYVFAVDWTSGRGYFYTF
jgi:hypothetical protein